MDRLLTETDTMVAFIQKTVPEKENDDRSGVHFGIVPFADMPTAGIQFFAIMRHPAQIEAAASFLSSYLLTIWEDLLPDFNVEDQE